VSAKLLSVAAIARELNVPESTLHYWKNRFAQFLPSVGRGRQKRFRAEAMPVFRAIAELLALGHSTKDIRAQLAERFPMTIETSPPAVPAPVVQPMAAPAATLDDQLRVAATVGAEIAKVIGQKLSETLELACGGRLPALSGEIGEASARLNTQAAELTSLRDENERLADRLKELESTLAMQAAAPAPPPTPLEVESLAVENRVLTDKLAILEAELVRLRKDRREMERYLLDKIEALRKTPG
jgi:DNA-binding transcriptional MerR regulator